MAGAMRAAKKLKPGQNCVVIFPDGVRNYLTKYMSDEWMFKKGCIESIPEEPKLYPKLPPTSPRNGPEYDPEKPPKELFQLLPNPWPQKPYK